MDLYSASLNAMCGENHSNYSATFLCSGGI